MEGIQDPCVQTPLHVTHRPLNQSRCLDDANWLQLDLFLWIRLLQQKNNRYRYLFYPWPIFCHDFQCSVDV